MIQHLTIPGILVLLFAAASLSVPAQDLSQETKKDIVRKLLESLETKDPKPLRFINPKKYIQHKLEIEDGLDGLKKVISRLPANTKANVVRIFADGDYVIAHSELNALVDRVAIDVFRFENGKIVEHWDNLEEKCANLNFSGRSQLDGPTELADVDKTESNKALVKEYFEAVVLGGRGDQIAKYRSMDNFHQHNCQGEDNKSGGQLTRGIYAEPEFVFKIEKVDKILGEGNFVLVMSESLFDAKSTAFYDLYRLEGNKIVEHWDVLEPMLPREQWKNTNGKF